MNTTTRNVLIFTLLVSSWARAADLSKVPQINETQEQRYERMQWFRDAKFGMFIHWGPCSIGKVDIGWGRKANRPWDINPNERRTEGLILSISEDGQKWQEVWRAKSWEAIWTVPLTHLDAGAQVPRKVRFIKVETINDTPGGCCSSASRLSAGSNAYRSNILWPKFGGRLITDN